MSQQAIDDIINSIPYAKTLGVKAELSDEGLILILPYKESNIGNPTLPALHGGAIGGFMEGCALAELRRRSLKIPFSKPIGINIDYLRRGNPVVTYARAVIFKEGSRVANVRVRAWQSSRDEPIAALSGHFLVPKKS